MALRRSQKEDEKRNSNTATGRNIKLEIANGNTPLKGVVLLNPKSFETGS